jgi:hypothetical protein
MPAFGTTNIQANDGVDIGYKFSAYAGGAQASASNWLDGPGGRELSTILMQLIGAQQVPNTGCQFPDGSDLAQHYGVGGPVGSGAYNNIINHINNPSANPQPASVTAIWTTFNDGTTSTSWGTSLTPGPGPKNGNWYLPTTSGIGSNYWVRYTWGNDTGTTRPGVNNGAVGWTSISSEPTIMFYITTRYDSIRSLGTCTIQIASDPNGSNIVYSQTVSFDLEIDVI